MSAAFLLWYVAFVLLASYARGVMATPVSGPITVGLLVGLAQFASTFALTAALRALRAAPDRPAGRTDPDRPGTGRRGRDHAPDRMVPAC
jgi:hypothetical protein